MSHQLNQASDDLTVRATRVQMQIVHSKHPLLPPWVGEAVLVIIAELDAIRCRLLDGA